ncbi:MAG: DNA repair protein RadC [Pseudomonadota bacterium]
MTRGRRKLLAGQDQARAKLITCGAASLSDQELLTVLLRADVRELPAEVLAGSLLNEFGGVRGLMEADEASLLATDPSELLAATYPELKAAYELTLRCLRSTCEKGDVISDPGVTRDYLTGRLRGYAREVFACMYLDNQHRLIKYEELFFGTIDGASVHPREVVKRVLKHNAAAVIFAHNHPSGVAEPSQADRRITDRLKSALLLIDVRVLDHMIVGDSEVLSFAERGLL